MTPDREKVIKGLNDIGGFVAGRLGIEQARNFIRTIDDACAMLKKQDDLLQKLQKDKDKLCLEVSEWKHKYHDRPLNEQEAIEPNHNPLSPTDWFCGKCGMCISRFHDYCPSCGQAVKWE